MPPRGGLGGGLGGALLYSVVVGTAGFLFWLGLPLLLFVGLESARMLGDGTWSGNPNVLNGCVTAAKIVLLTPITFTIAPMTIACILYALLYVFGMKRVGFEGAARVVCYVTASWIVMAAGLPAVFHAFVLVFAGFLTGISVAGDIFVGAFSFAAFYERYHTVLAIPLITIVFGNLVFPFMFALFYFDACWKGFMALYRAKIETDAAVGQVLAFCLLAPIGALSF